MPDAPDTVAPDTVAPDTVAPDAVAPDTAATDGAGGIFSTQRLRIGLVVCGAVVREVQTIARRHGWQFELTAIPAQLHNRPEKIAPAVARVLDEWANRFDLILVGYADCGTGGALDALVARYEHVERIAGPHCYEFFAGPGFDVLMDEEPGTFFLTDFLARHFDGLVWKGLGLDRWPELRDLYFGNYQRVVYLRQTAEGDDEDRLVWATEAAAQLGLPLAVVDTGLGPLEARLIEIASRHAIRLAVQTNPNPGAPSLPVDARL